MTQAANLAASAANINASGKVNVSGINATGTPSSSTFLRGDGSWQTAGGDPTTTQVLTATAGASAGAVGAYSFLVTSSAVSTGNTIAGSNTRYANANSNYAGGFNNVGGTPSGTWRCMGSSHGSGPYGNYFYSCLFLRIS